MTAPRLIRTTCPVCAKPVQAIAIGNPVRGWKILNHGKPAKRCAGSGSVIDRPP